MAVRDIIDQAAADIWAAAAEHSAVFRPATGDPVECLVEVEHDVDLIPESYEATVVTRGTTIEALVSDVGTPKRGDVFEVLTDGGVWTVGKIVENDGQFVKVVVSAD